MTTMRDKNNKDKRIFVKYSKKSRRTSNNEKKVGCHNVRRKRRGESGENNRDKEELRVKEKGLFLHDFPSKITMINIDPFTKYFYL
jgi:hypothetical protein